MLKKCIKCGLKKTLEDFSKHPRTKDGRAGVCRLCVNKRRKKRRLSGKDYATQRRYANSKKGKEVNKKAFRKYRNNHPGERHLTERKSRLKREFGITPQQYNEMLKQQNGGCAICGGINKNGRRLAVDHDHDTGEIRGLLCNKCNSVLGWAGDSIAVLAGAIKYLNKMKDL